MAESPNRHFFLFLAFSVHNIEVRLEFFKIVSLTRKWAFAAWEEGSISSHGQKIKKYSSTAPPTVLGC